MGLRVVLGVDLVAAVQLLTPMSRSCFQLLCLYLFLPQLFKILLTLIINFIIITVIEVITDLTQLTFKHQIDLTY